MSLSFLNIKKKKKTTNLGWLIVVTITISLVMVFISLYIFFKSSAYDTVIQIRSANQKLAEDDLQGYDTKSPVQSTDLQNHANSIQPRIKQFNDQEDFSLDLVDPTQLGL